MTHPADPATIRLLCVEDNPDDEELTQTRLWLSRATKQSIANVLGLLGVSAPERM